MELLKCEECGKSFSYRKTLGRHTKDVHKILYVDYLMKHGKSEKCVCGCGKEFENTRYPGGPRKNGRRQIYCSPECTHKATNVRFYGLTLSEYYTMLRKQEFKCAICQKHVDDEIKLLAVDHEHVDGFEDMSPAERKRYIRGLLCILCNKHRLAALDLETARRIVQYLESYTARR